MEAEGDLRSACRRGRETRAERRVGGLQGLDAHYQISLDDARRRIVSWIGHARQADTYRLRQRLFLEHPFRRSRAP
jgi:hypothetical protein